MPTVKSGAVKTPWVLLITVRVSAVATFLIDTSALGTDAPCESVTTPCMVPVMVCAPAGNATHKQMSNSQPELLRMFSLHLNAALETVSFLGSRVMFRE